MTTTDKGIPLYDFTDDADLPTKFNAQAAAVNGLITSSRQMARATTLTLVEATWRAVDGYGAGTIYNLGDIDYLGSGVFQVNTAGLYPWAFTGMWQEPTSGEFRGVKLQVNGSDLTYQQGAHLDSIGSTVGGAVYFPWSVCGKVPLDVNDEVQVFVWSSGTGSGNNINSLITTIG